MYWLGPTSQGVVGTERESVIIIYVALRCHHHNDSICIKMASGVSHLFHYVCVCWGGGGGIYN